jgi:tetratricopeptide (TPR) repeat protein
MSSLIFAQIQEADIQKRLDLIENGKTEQVRSELPALLEKYSNDPGVIYLDGILTADGKEAVKIFQNIVDRFPKSIWAGDAFYKVYQYYYSIGLYRKAESVLEDLKKSYPNSKYTATIKIDLTDEIQGDSKAIHYSAQVGAYVELENATKQKSLLEELGYSVQIRNKVKEEKTVHLVWVGDFHTYTEAQQLIKTLKTKHSIGAVVVSW